MPNKSIHRLATLSAVALSLAACGGDDGTDPFATASDSIGSASNGTLTATASGTDGTDSGTSGTGGTSTSGGSGSDTNSTSDSATDGSTSGDPKFDIAVSDIGQTGCNNPDGECGCSYVDLLFVIDNSGSMGSYQEALGLAFPQFADTLVSALPAGTNVHVGVTSTEMGYSGSGSTSINNGVCQFTGDNNQNEDAFYITPDNMNSGTNGAQGRLYQANGDYYADFDTDAGQAAIDALKTWFVAAANIGTGGSNIEMLTAPAGWAAHTANDATNAGFIRDEGAVMVVFFMQDEPDQTPMTINGQPGGTEMLTMLSGAKQACGGVDCIIAGGFLNDNACGGRPIDDFLDGLPDMPNINMLPDSQLAKNNPQAAADEMNMLLSDTLANVIAQKCDEIPPVG